MKSNILPALKLTLACLLFFSGIYTLFIYGIAQCSRDKGNGFLLDDGNKTYYENIAQPFSEDKYFQSRPSAVNYNAAGSGGSNKGPSDPVYLQTVQDRIDSFLVHNPGIDAKDIPSDLVTASGSGQDPDISVQAAKVQVKRIAAARKIPESAISSLIDANTEKPFLGMFGPERINVLKLNIALDNLK